MSKMATMPIYGKNTLQSFPGTSGGPMSTKLVMEHRRLGHIIFCSVHSPGLTMTFFTARSIFATGFYIGKCDND